MKKEIIIGIYMITSPTGKIYIGKSEDIHRRWHWYKLGHCKSQIKLFRSFNMHGIENHKFEIIELCTIDQLNEREIHYIKFYNTFDTPHGLNLTSGGEGGKLSEESLKKISISLKARRHIYGPRVLSEEHKKNIGLGGMGKLGTMKGKKHTKESKDKISESLIGNTRSLGKKQKSETIEKRRKSLMGKNKGKKYGPMSELEREKRRKGGKLAWIKRKESAEYNSEESKQRRKEISKIGAKAMREAANERIRQERLMMIF